MYMNLSWYDKRDQEGKDRKGESDTNKLLELSSRLVGDTIRIKEGMGKKLGDVFRFSVQFYSVMLLDLLVAGRCP